MQRTFKYLHLCGITVFTLMYNILYHFEIDISLEIHNFQKENTVAIWFSSCLKRKNHNLFMKFQFSSVANPSNDNQTNQSIFYCFFYFSLPKVKRVTFVLKKKKQPDCWRDLSRWWLSKMLRLVFSEQPQWLFYNSYNIYINILLYFHLRRLGNFAHSNSYLPSSVLHNLNCCKCFINSHGVKIVQVCFILTLL